jgi:YggT family protein
MVQLIRFVNFFLDIYTMILFVRIILTWFSWLRESRIREVLSLITDPYLNWFRRFTFLRIGYVDLSPIAALAVLSLARRLLTMLALQGRISIGIILALALQAAWGIVSFIIGFLIIVLILHLIGSFVRQGGPSPFWNIIESISKPVIYRINRIVFKNAIINFKAAVFLAIASLGAVYLVLMVLVSIISGMLIRLPL